MEATEPRRLRKKSYRSPGPLGMPATFALSNDGHAPAVLSAHQDREDVKTQPALALTRHNSQDLLRIVAAVAHVNELVARERNVLAHLHERLVLLPGETLVYLGLSPCAPPWTPSR
jgi:hypothetical protein